MAQQEVLPVDESPKLFSITVDAGPIDRPVSVVKKLIPVKLMPTEPSPTVGSDAVRISGVDDSGHPVACQVSAPGIQYDHVPDMKLLTFVVSDLKANGKRRYNFFPSSGKQYLPVFVWHDDQSTQAELRYGTTGVLRYMYEAPDAATDERRQETCKAYHHLFSPDGKQLVTKGPGGLYPHHRGIFFGFNRIDYDGKQADVWHCQHGESQVHTQSISEIGGPVFGRDINMIIWNGQDGKPFAQETRQLTAYRINGATLVEFNSILETLVGDVTLDGDPQHAGVQFRASQHVAEKTNTKTYYIRPDGVDKPGSFRNWSASEDEVELNRNHRNLPWDAINFRIDDHQFTCCYFDKTTNPKPAMYSERDYGRFGSYFKYRLTPKKPLEVEYRFWLQDGVMSPEEIEGLSQSLLTPVSVSMD